MILKILFKINTKIYNNRFFCRVNDKIENYNTKIKINNAKIYNSEYNKVMPTKIEFKLYKRKQRGENLKWSHDDT